MKNIFNSDKCKQFYSFCSDSSRIAVVSHTNPDGDAVGSGLALTLYLREAFPSAATRFFVPNYYPSFVGFVDPDKDIEIYGEMCKEAEAFLAAADLIICVDFNVIMRLDRMGEAIDMNLHAPRIVIDHHLDPPAFDLAFHTTESSSTALLIYKLIVALSGEGVITPAIGTALYLGMMTDTGTFSYSNLTSDLFRAVATLVDCGVDPVAVHQAVYDSQSESRLRMVGYLLSEKMVVRAPQRAAYITLTQDEKARFNHQIGDTEGVVNMPLSISGIDFSAILIETKDCIKVSLRSQGDIDVNVLGRSTFNGGGHKNAAGGRLYSTMDEAIATLEQVIINL